MGESIYKAFLTSLLRTGLKLLAGALVARGLVDESLASEVAAGLAIAIVTVLWDFWRIYRRQLVQKGLLLLGLKEESPQEGARPDGSL